MTRWLAAALLAGVALLLQPPPPVQAEENTVYRWVDDGGITHLVQGLNAVPPRYRARAIPLGSMSGLEPATRAPELPEAGPKPPGPDDPERGKIDEELSRARTAAEALAAGRAYLRMGLPLAATSAANKAAGLARTAGDWERIADAYDAIGRTESSLEARRKAAELRREDRPAARTPGR